MFLVEFRGSFIRLRKCEKRGILRQIGIHTHGILVGFENPHISIPKVSKKRVDIPARNLPRPNRFGAVDIRVVIYKLFVNVVFRGISNEDKVFAWKFVEPLFDCSARGQLGSEVGWFLISKSNANLPNRENDQSEFKK